MSLHAFNYDQTKSVKRNLKNFNDQYSSTEIKPILRSRHTAKASLLAYALDNGSLKDRHYLKSTFTLMFLVQVRTTDIATYRPPHATPLILTIYEDSASLLPDLRRIFAIPDDNDISLRGFSPKLQFNASPNGWAGLRLVDDMEANLRFLNTETTGTYVRVEVE